MTDLIPCIDFRKQYDCFNLPVTNFDCGKLCAPHNPHGIPFCCDICLAVPAAYLQEWDYLRNNTDLWHAWRGDECLDELTDPASLSDETPGHMLLLACRGPKACQREYRSMSCRQFPFYPYITADDRILGLAYHWDFESTCWVISNLGAVTDTYRGEFMRVFDGLLAAWDEDFESYAALSEEMRAQYAAKKRPIPILHRNGGTYLLSPRNERLKRVLPERLPKFGPYR